MILLYQTHHRCWMKTLQCPGVKSVQSVFCAALSIPDGETLHFFHSMGKTDCRLSLQSRNPWSWMGFSIILLKDTKAEKKLAVILGLLAGRWCCKSLLLLCLLMHFNFLVYTAENKEKGRIGKKKPLLNSF